MNKVVSAHDVPATFHDGFIVVAVLWLLTGLATLAIIASVYMAQSAVTLTALDGVTQREMLATAGVELAAYELSMPEGSHPQTRGSFSFALAGSRVHVDYVSEAARINLNMASRAMIAGLFTSLGTKAETADQYADRVIGWRTAPKPDAQDEEIALYRNAGLNYLPRRSPFNSMDELWLVWGLPEALVRRVMPYVTIYSGTADVDVLDAEPPVLAALPGMTPEKIKSFLGARDSLPPNDLQAMTDALGGKLQGATASGGNYYRVRMRIVLPHEAPAAVEVVIKASSGAQEKVAYRVLAWQDQTEQSER